MVVAQRGEHAIERDAGLLGRGQSGVQPLPHSLDQSREHDRDPPRNSPLRRCGRRHAHPANTACSSVPGRGNRGAVGVGDTSAGNGATVAIPAAGEVRGAGGQEGDAGSAVAAHPLAWVAARRHAVRVRLAASGRPGRAARAVAAADVAGDAIDDEVGAEPVDAGAPGAGIEVPVEAIVVPETAGWVWGCLGRRNALGAPPSPSHAEACDNRPKDAAPPTRGCPRPGNAVEVLPVHRQAPFRAPALLAATRGL
jgi:hypothetical protein